MAQLDGIMPDAMEDSDGEFVESLMKEGLLEGFDPDDSLLLQTFRNAKPSGNGDSPTAVTENFSIGSNESTSVSTNAPSMSPNMADPAVGGGGGGNANDVEPAANGKAFVFGSPFQSIASSANFSEAASDGQERKRRADASGDQQPAAKKVASDHVATFKQVWKIVGGEHDLPITEDDIPKLGQRLHEAIVTHCRESGNEQLCLQAPDVVEEVIPVTEFCVLMDYHGASDINLATKVWKSEVRGKREKVDIVCVRDRRNQVREKIIARMGSDTGVPKEIPFLIKANKKGTKVDSKVCIFDGKHYKEATDERIA